MGPQSESQTLIDSHSVKLCMTPRGNPLWQLASQGRGIFKWQLVFLSTSHQIYCPCKNTFSRTGQKKKKYMRRRACVAVYTAYFIARLFILRILLYWSLSPWASKFAQEVGLHAFIIQICRSVCKMCEEGKWIILQEKSTHNPMTLFTAVHVFHLVLVLDFLLPGVTATCPIACLISWICSSVISSVLQHHLWAAVSRHGFIPCLIWETCPPSRPHQFGTSPDSSPGAVKPHARQDTELQW